jgi:3-dehydroquinate synthase
MLEAGFGRKDCVVAVGGGICGDLAGFVAASYMRGVDFYNIPTTLLSQVDSSIGGKTAVNLDGIKNVVGAFYQPKKVLIDPEVLKTLPKRQIAAGLAEALKMAVTFDEDLFKIFEDTPESLDSFPTLGDVQRTTTSLDSKNKQSQKKEVTLWPGGQGIDRIIEESLRIKGRVVEEDEKEQGLRRVLNFGHTIGHGIESQCLDGSLYHGECVALGMLPMCSKEIRQRLLPIYKKLDLPTSCRIEADRVYEALLHDKKAQAGMITIVETDRIGSYRMRTVDPEELREKIAMISLS